MATSLTYKRPVFYGLVERIASRVPEGDFYVRQFALLPYTFGETAFTLVTDYPSRPHEIVSNGKVIASFTPGSAVQDIGLKLDKGIAQLIVRVDDTIIYSTGLNVSLYVTLYLAMSLDWRFIWTDLIQLRQNIESKLHLLLYETKLPDEYYDVLPSGLRSVLALRDLLYARNHPLSTESVRRLTSAIAGSSPHYRPVQAMEEHELNSDVLVNNQDDVAAQEIHVWYDDPCLVRMTTFMKLAWNLDNYHLNSSTETDVVFAEDSSPE